MCETRNGGCPKVQTGIVGKNCDECCRLETRLLDAFTTSHAKALTIGPIAERFWQLLFPAEPKSKKEDGQEYILFAVSGVGISPDEVVDADYVRQRHYPLPKHPETMVNVQKYFRRMKLAQSRVHTVCLSLGPATAFARPSRHITGVTCGHYDVVLRKVPDIYAQKFNDRGDTKKQVLMTDGAGLVGQGVLKLIVRDYALRNPDAHAHVNLSAFQGRVGPNKGVWVVWPDHVIENLLHGHVGTAAPANRCLLFRDSQQKWNMDETYDTKIEVCRFGPQTRSGYCEVSKRAG